MDAAPPTASELSEESRWSGHTSPHKLAQALSLLLPLLPLDTRARAACVCRAWRAAAAPPVLWAELSFEHCAVCIHNAALTKLCARAGAALRTLNLEAIPYILVTFDGVLAALRGGGCTGLRRLSVPHRLGEHFETCNWLSAEQVQQLAATCPRLTHTACSVRCSPLEAAAAAAALPGPLLVSCTCYSPLLGDYGDRLL